MPLTDGIAVNALMFPHGVAFKVDDGAFLKRGVIFSRCDEMPIIHFRDKTDFLAFPVSMAGNTQFLGPDPGLRFGHVTQGENGF